MPITGRGRASLVHVIFGSVVQFLMLLVFTSSGILVCAQTVTIKLVNGRNGHPMSNSHVNVWVGTKRKEAMVIPTDKDGIARLRLTDSDDEVDLHMREKCIGDNVVIDPIVKYDENFQVNVGFVICYPNVRDYSWLATTNISTKQLLQQGIVWPNTCGKAIASPKPGELVIFVRPLSWWEKLKQ
jgi:hypothetical protein